MVFSIIVQKYGGSSVADSTRIKKVAEFIKSCLQDGKKIAVVVSAMGHTTNELITLARNVCADPPKRELDMLISCGERSSMALLAMALTDIGVRSRSLTGSQSGIITDDNHNGAEIIAIKPQRLMDAFLDHDVVIIAGFQGVSERKEITTLRRGGSDTTAVALAAALQARVCEIYTDVPGVMDIDPRIAKSASVMTALSFEQMESMALYGARVLAHDAIRIAKEFGVSMRIAKTGEQQCGTKITRVPLTSSDENKIAITHLRALVRISMNCSQLATMKNEAGYFLCGNLYGDKITAYISNDISQELIDKQTHIDAGLALITIHLKKNQMALTVLAEVNQIMAQHQINCEDLIFSGAQIFVIIKDRELNQSLELLHQGLLRMENDP